MYYEGKIMTRISNERYFLTPTQRAEIIEKQKRLEPLRAKLWEEKRQILIAAEKEREKYDCSVFTRVFNPK